MLNNLIESTDLNLGNTRRSRLMMVSLTLVTASLFGAWTFSLFAKDFGMGDGEYDISRLVAPVAVAPEAPTPRSRPVTERRQSPVVPKKVVLPEFFDEIGKTAPQSTAGQPNVKDASKFDPNLLERGPESIPTDVGVRGSGEGTGIVGGTGDGQGEGEAAPEMKKEEPRVPKTVSGGVVNGRAVNLVKPAYPAMAKAVRASGDVNVQVTIDEKGNVVAARAVDGHPTLRSAAEKAARSSTFSPTTLSNQPVKVTGIIVYRFTV